MRRLDLPRLLRGSHRRAVEDLIAMVPGSCRIDDLEGRLLLGSEACAGERVPIVAGGASVGVVQGGPGVERVARLVAHLFDREHEKLALAAETLGRYKELTVLSDPSAALSRVLDVNEVATLVATEARRFLGAEDVSVLLLDRREAGLEAIAQAGADVRSFSLEGTIGRVLESGRPELVEDADEREGGGSLVVAPLRAGERVFGFLHVHDTRSARWNAGDLKLVTSLAANAAAAISHAMLHRDQLRQQALRNRIERFVSPSLVEVAREGASEELRSEPLAVLVFDVGELSRALDHTLDADAVLDAMLRAGSAAMDVLYAHGAAAVSAQGEMVVALFADRGGLMASVRAAVSAARALYRRLDARYEGTFGRVPGVGIGCVREADSFSTDVGVAASLQGAAEGRILMTARVAEALAGEHVTRLVEPLEMAETSVEVHEVEP